MQPPKIGFSSHCFPKNTEMDRILDFCEEHNFNAMELNTNTQNFDLRTVKESVLARIRRMADSGKVCFSLHPSDGVNFSAPLAEQRQQSLDKTEEALRIASSIGVKVVPVHPGNLNGEAAPEQFQEALEQSIAAIRRCAVTAGELGVGLSVENLCHVKGTVAPNIRCFMSMCERIGLSLIGMTLDTGHAALVDGLEQTVAAIGRHVNHIHLDDSSLLRSDHLELGTGKIDFPAIADYLRTFDGILNIELKAHGEDAAGPILRSRDYLLRLLSAGEAGGRAPRGGPSSGEDGRRTTRHPTPPPSGLPVLVSLETALNSHGQSRPGLVVGRHSVRKSRDREPR